MGVRVGVDVGGTFTKAVAVDLEAGIVAESVLPTTHDAAEGVAAGVVQCVAEVAAKVGADQIELVTHSTTQAVNALLEGDVGIGRHRRDGTTARARARRASAPSSPKVELSAGKHLATVPRVPRRHRRPRRERRPRRAASSCATAACRRSRPPRRSRPTTRRTRHESRRWRPSLGLPVVRVDRPVRAVRPRAARRDRRGRTRRSCRSRCAPRATSRRACSPPASTRRSWSCAATAAPPTSPGFKAAPARTLYSGPAASVVGRAAVHRRARRHRRRGRRHVDERRRREARAALALVRHGRVPRDRAPRRRRAGDRRRRRLDAPRATRARSGASGPARAHIAGLPVRLLHRRRAPRGRDAVDDRRPAPATPTTTSCSSSPTARASRSRITCAANALVDPRARRLLLGRPGGGARSRSTSPAVTSASTGDELARRMLWAGGEAVVRARRPR